MLAVQFVIASSLILLVGGGDVAGGTVVSWCQPRDVFEFVDTLAITMSKPAYFMARWWRFYISMVASLKIARV